VNATALVLALVLNQLSAPTVAEADKFGAFAKACWVKW
jgi:hypothetical protein